MKLSVKIFLLALVCVTASAAGQTNVVTVNPKNGTIRKLLQFTGETRPVIEAYVAADVNGPVAQIMAEDGQKVQQGEPLGKIDDIRFAITLRQMEAALERAKQQFQENGKDYERNKTLFEKKAITQKSLDAAFTNYITGKTTAKQAQADYDKAKLDLDRCIIRSPISGHLLTVQLSLGRPWHAARTWAKL